MGSFAAWAHSQLRALQAHTCTHRCMCTCTRHCAFVCACVSSSDEHCNLTPLTRLAPPSQALPATLEHPSFAQQLALVQRALQRSEQHTLHSGRWGRYTSYNPLYVHLLQPLIHSGRWGSGYDPHKSELTELYFALVDAGDEAKELRLEIDSPCASANNAACGWLHGRRVTVRALLQAHTCI